MNGYDKFLCSLAVSRLLGNTRETMTQFTRNCQISMIGTSGKDDKKLIVVASGAPQRPADHILGITFDAD